MMSFVNDPKYMLVVSIGTVLVLVRAVLYMECWYWEEKQATIKISYKSPY